MAFDGKLLILDLDGTLVCPTAYKLYGSINEQYELHCDGCHGPLYIYIRPYAFDMLEEVHKRKDITKVLFSAGSHHYVSRVIVNILYPAMRARPGCEDFAFAAVYTANDMPEHSNKKPVADVMNCQGGINLYGDVVLLCAPLDITPAGGFRQIKDVLHGVELHHVDIFFLAFCHEIRPALFKFIGNELEEDQAQDNVLVLGRFDASP